MDRIRLLVVDDHAMMRDCIGALLGLHKDIEIIGEASEGREAIQKTRELAPDVVVMDIAMPEMDGLEATRRIVKNKSSAKVLVLTQHNDREYILSSIKAGVMGYVPKTAVGSELISAIRAVYRGESFLSSHMASFLVEQLRQQVKKAVPHDRLTAREREILNLIANGRTSREIATILSIGLKTVLNHRMKTMKKLDIHTQTELIKYCIRKGLTSTN
jgi:DNA-binding NarL/FixJ family response regulator